MRGGERTEWPSQAHLDELREEGQTPYSPVFTRAACLIAVISSVPMLKGSAQKAFSCYTGMVEAGQFDVASMKAFGQSVLPLLVAPVLLVAGMICLSALLQTRFMLRFSNIGIDFTRLLKLHAPPASGRVVSAVVCAFVICILGVSFSCWITYSLFDLLNGDELGLSLFYAKLFRLSAKFFLPFAFLLCLAGWLGSRLWFMHLHRMTRQEVEAEARER